MNNKFCPRPGKEAFKQLIKKGIQRKIPQKSVQVIELIQTIMIQKLCGGGACL